MKKLKNTAHTETEVLVAKFSKALGHPTRVAILNYLASLECCFFGDICNELPIANSTVSQHLDELKSSGLIQGAFEPPKVKYCINEENWEKARIIYDNFFKPLNKSKKCINKIKLWK